jgi:hypothetical protein
VRCAAEGASYVMVCTPRYMIMFCRYRCRFSRMSHVYLICLGAPCRLFFIVDFCVFGR